MAERVGFEATELLRSLVFKTSAISQTLPPIHKAHRERRKDTPWVIEGSGFEPELGHAIDVAPNELTFTNAQTKKEEDVWTMPTIGLEPTTLCL